jgi:nitrite reductase/ring-hydroxylating ferredoxin subunit
VPPPPIARYDRSVRASLERVWENVLDWEHLPWLHRTSFRDIRREEEGDWGWRARVWLHPEDVGREIRIEVIVDRTQNRYVTRTLEGAGAGTEIWTELTPRGEHETGVQVEFCMPGLDGEGARLVGEGYRRLYARLWDEDESMMVRRAALLAAPGPAHGTGAAPLALGPLEALRARLPVCVELGGRGFRIVELAGELVAHATQCPHFLGPLDSARVEDGRVRCPWHGYVFDVRSGESGDGRRLRLPRAPRVHVSPQGEVTLAFEQPPAA